MGPRRERLGLVPGKGDPQPSGSRLNPIEAGPEGPRIVSLHAGKRPPTLVGMLDVVMPSVANRVGIVQRQPSFYGLSTRSQNSQITARHFERSREISLK